MNKLFTKIAALALGATMAVGVGVAVASNGKAAESVHAANSTYQKLSSLSASKEVLIVTHSTSGQYYLMDAVTAATSAGPKYITCSLSNSQITGDYDSHLFTVSASSTNWKFATGSKYLKWSGTSSNTAIRINTGDSNNTWTYSGGTMKFSSATRYLGVYTSGSDWRSYNSSTATNYSGTGANIEFYEKVAAKTLSSISVSGYTTSFTVGDTFSFGGTVTAHYSDETSANVTASATFSGYNMSTAGNYTVTASYTEGGVTKTATYSITVAAATSPTLSFDKTSFSGYTGQTVSVTATYANLESDLAWSAAGTGSISGGNITWSSSDHRNGTSTYTATLSGEGGKTIVADADGVDAAQCTVTITQTTVDITKSSTSIPVGRSETLAASHNASSVGGLSWTSSDDSIATVGSDGKVTVANGATVGDTVTITATSSVDNSVSDTCTVTVTEAPLEYEVIFGTAEGTSGISDFSNTSYVIPSGVTLDNIQGNVYSNTSNQAASLRFGKSGTTGSFDATISGNYYIVSVKCNLKYYGSDTTATFSVTPDGGSAVSKSLTSSWADYTFDVSAANAKTVTLGTDVNGKRAYLSGFTITYAASTEPSEPSLSWTTPTIDVYSGATLTSSDANAWAVTYDDGTGDTTVLTSNQFTIKLGGSTISLPHEWVAADDSKSLYVEYSSLSTSASAATVAVTQTINAVNAPLPGEETTSTLTFTAACSGSGTSDGGEEWTVTSDGTESTYDPTKGIHYGTSGAAVKYINLTSSDFTTGRIIKVVVNASTASGVTATVAVNVGGSAFGGAAQSLSTTATEYTFDDEVDADEIEVVITKPSSATKAIYCKSIAVTYATEGSETDNIANVVGHEADQRAAVAFAQAFNEIMDDTENCTTGMSDAESACSSLFSSFNSSASTYAKKLVKYATAKYTAGSPEEACIERMMKTYEICVKNHGWDSFMSDLVTVGRAPVSPIANVVDNSNAVAVVVIVSMISVTAIGGYFFLRKRKEN